VSHPLAQAGAGHSCGLCEATSMRSSRTARSIAARTSARQSKAAIRRSPSNRGYALLARARRRRGDPSKAEERLARPSHTRAPACACGSSKNPAPRVFHAIDADMSAAAPPPRNPLRKCGVVTACRAAAITDHIPPRRRGPADVAEVGSMGQSRPAEQRAGEPPIIGRLFLERGFSSPSSGAIASRCAQMTVVHGRELCPGRSPPQGSL